jgi:3-dehydroquinate dehydratase-1
VRPIVIRGKPAAGGKLPLICVPLVGADRSALESEAKVAAAAQPDIVEWRVDHFRDIGSTAAVIDAARMLRGALPGVPLLFTRRSAAEGGQRVPISEQAAVDLYAEVCAADCVDLVDYEMSNGAASMKAVRDASRPRGIGLVCSYHNFESTPPLPQLAAEFERARTMDGDVAKVSVMARSPDDAFVLLAATRQASQAMELPVIGISMGPQGAASRIIGFAFGSALTFGVAAASSAPGQMPVADLRAAIESTRQALGG